MKKGLCFTLAAALLFVVFSAGSADAAEKWVIDPFHSSVRFQIKHIVGWVSGGFDKFDGVILYDPPDVTKGSVSFTIDTSSINTGVDKRDAHLRTADFFEADKYPTISFKSTTIRQIEGDHYEANGQLTIKDTTRDIALPFTFLGVKDNPIPDLKGSRVLGLEILYTLNRFDYGVGTGQFFKMGATGDQVAITIFIEALNMPE